MNFIKHLEEELYHFQECLEGDPGCPYLQREVASLKEQFEALNNLPKFHYDVQEYRDANGKAVDGYGGMFPCPKCHRPSNLEWFDSYRESYKCVRCHHEFSVN